MYHLMNPIQHYIRDVGLLDVDMQDLISGSLANALKSLLKLLFEP